MSANTGLYGVVEAQEKQRKHMSWKQVSLASVFVFEQLAFILDEAQAALMRPSVVTCERALKRIEEMAGDALPLAVKMLSPSERDDTEEDIWQELNRKASRRKCWLKEPTPIIKEMAQRRKNAHSS